MLISRNKEKDALLASLKADEAQFVAVYGRRRVGKTFLIRECLEPYFVFSHSGIYAGSYHDQLEAFGFSLADYGLKLEDPPEDWFRAFHLLKEVIRVSKKRKKVIFLDELSWMATRNSRFIKALEQFWNSFLSARKDVVLVVCASATSWILDNVVHNKGGLHNRLTLEINLKPFSLKEIEMFVKAKRLDFTRRQIVEGYMVLGGIPYYWGKLQRGLSMASNIDALFVGDSAPLRKENQHLFKALFENPEVYVKIVSSLAKGERAGMDYSSLAKETGVEANGVFSDCIDELEECGFVRKYAPFGKKSRGTLIQLIDNFTLFFHKYLDPMPTDEHFFSSSLESGSWRAWSGLAFERICLQHARQIQEALRIGGVRTDVCSFSCRKGEKEGVEGSQIDMLIVRKDETINLCEMKYSTKPYSVSQEDVYDMETKRDDLRIMTGTDYAIVPTLVAFPSIKRNAYSDEFSIVIDADALFQI